MQQHHQHIQSATKDIFVRLLRS